MKKDVAKFLLISAIEGELAFMLKEEKQAMALAPLIEDRFAYIQKVKDAMYSRVREYLTKLQELGANLQPYLFHESEYVRQEAKKLFQGDKHEKTR